MAYERDNPADSFVGAWRLVSWETRSAAGDVSHPYGEAPEGQIIYTSNGQMSAQLMNPGAALPEVAGSSDEDVIAQVAATFFAYHGTYSLDESARTVTHHVSGSLAPSWVGTDQVREYEFLSDDRLRLSAVIKNGEVAREAGVTGRQILVWQRIR